MPFITSEKVAAIRKQIKTEFPAIKFSIVCRNNCKVDISILESPFVWEKDYIQCNEYYLNRYAHSDVLQRLYDIANASNGVLVEDADYGTVPNYYVNVSIGKWDKPHRTV